MEKPPVSVFAYLDYRAFLKDYYEHARRQDRRFSQRYLAAQLGFASGSWFNGLLNGKSNLKGSHLIKLAGLLKLRSKEADYLEALMHYNHAGSMEERNRCFRKLLAFKEVSADLIGPDKFEYFTKWYYAAIRELLILQPYKGDFESLAKKLNPPIKAAQAQEAIALLVRLGFIRKDAQGFYRSRQTVLKKDPSFKTLHLANYLRANMELAMLALERIGKDERHITAMTLSFSGHGYDQAVSEIESFRKRIVSMMNDDKRPDKVFQFNIQFFPVTR